jgi:hypothetical protein
MRRSFLVGLFLIVPLVGLSSCADDPISEDPADTVSGYVGDDVAAERAVATPADPGAEVDIDALEAEPGSELSYLLPGGGGGKYCKKECDCECRCKHGKCRWDDCDHKKKCKKHCEGEWCKKKHDDHDDDHDEHHDEDHDEDHDEKHDEKH